MQQLDPEQIHPDFERVLSDRPMDVQFLYRDVRAAILARAPQCTEILYHTHALTSVYSHSPQLKHAFCHIPVYKAHINLGFNSGTRLDDPDHLLEGTGAKIRHVRIHDRSILESPPLLSLIDQAIETARLGFSGTPPITGTVISKIKT